MPDRAIASADARRPAGLALAAAAFGFVVLTARPAQAADVEVSVANVNGASGHVRVALCTRTTFLKPGCPYFASAPARPGETVVTITGVEPGDYAAEAYYDDTDANLVHQDRLGVPREGVGFSNDAPLHLKGPRFGDAAFTVRQDGARIHLRLRYLSASNWDQARSDSASSQ